MTISGSLTKLQVLHCLEPLASVFFFFFLHILIIYFIYYEF